MTAADASTHRTRALGAATLRGLQLAVLLGLLDVVGTVVIPAPEAGVDGPPAGTLALGAALGLLTVGLALWATRTGSRTTVRVVAGLRILSAVTALPSFFVDVATWVTLVSAVFVLLTVTCVVLLLRPAGTRAPVTD